MGRTVLVAPSHIASEVFDVPKSRPNLTRPTPRAEYPSAGHAPDGRERLPRRRLQTILEVLLQLRHLRRRDELDVRLIGMLCGVVLVVVLRRVEAVELRDGRDDRCVEDLGRVELGD